MTNAIIDQLKEKMASSIDALETGTGEDQDRSGIAFSA